MMDPLEVARLAIDALNRGEWDDVAALVDAEEAEQWFRERVGGEERPLPPVTAEYLKRYQPDLPDAVAAYQAEQLSRQREESRGTLHGEFAGVNTREELARLSPREALARYLQAQDPSWQFEEQVQRLHPKLVPLARPGSVSVRRDVVGVVYEGEQFAHVVYRAGYRLGGEGEEPEGDLHVLTLRQRADGWVLRLRGELFEHGGSVMVLDASETDASEEG